MDVLSEVLRAVRLTGAIYFDVRVSGTWVAETPALEGFVADSLDRVEASDRMVIGTLLVASALINLTYLVMAADVEISQDAQGNRTWSVKKPTSPPELITKLVGLVTGIIPKTV